MMHTSNKLRKKAKYLWNSV